MSYRSGRRRVIAWSIILALALCALIWGLANGPRLHWGVANRNNFTTVKQQEMDDSVSQLRIDWGLGDIILTQSEDSSLHILQKAEAHEDTIYFSTRQTGNALEISSEKSARWVGFFPGKRTFVRSGNTDSQRISGNAFDRYAERYNQSGGYKGGCVGPCHRQRRWRY